MGATVSAWTSAGTGIAAPRGKPEHRRSSAATPFATVASKASAAWEPGTPLVEDNLIEWCGWADAERGWEAAGAKFHFAHNLLFRRNVVRHIRHANGDLARQRRRQLPHHQQRVRRHCHRQRRRTHGDESGTRTRSTTTSFGMFATPSRARPAREDARDRASSSMPPII